MVRAGLQLGGANVEYKQLVFVAAQWLEEYDEKTGTLYLRAGEGDSSVTCELLATPIPGTNPVKFEYSCREVNCDSECRLESSPSPGGTIYRCRCVGGSLLAKSASKTKKKASSKRTKKARRSK